MTRNLVQLYVYFFLSIASCFGNDHHHKRVGIITSKKRYAEREIAARMQIAGERLGWTVLVDENNGEGFRNIPLDFAISMMNEDKLQFRSFDYPHYLTIYHKGSFFNKTGDLEKEYTDYNGYLLTIDKTGLSNFDSTEGTQIAPSIAFYPTAYSTTYQQVNPVNLTYIIPSWGNRINTPPFRQLNKLLKKDNFTKFYGSSEFAHLYGKQYQGTLPFDGRSIIDTFQKNGVALIIHSNMHIEDKIPSGRIFEAAAASAIIISDQNPFVQKYFGDSIFYIDTSLPGRAIFSQIQRHIQTIVENPNKALEMAKKAHGIFLDNFTMEAQLLELELMHEQILGKLKN